MTKPHSEPPPAIVADEVPAKAFCGEAIRAVRIIRGRPSKLAVTTKSLPVDMAEPAKPGATLG